MAIISAKPLLCLMWLLTMNTVCVDGQMAYCNEFISPQRLTTEGSSVGVIRMPLKGAVYSRNQLCEWIIECKPGEIIQLQVNECSIQDRDIEGECNKDYVNIFDFRNGETYFMARFCGTDKGMVYQSTGTMMIVRFFSDGVYEYSGFRLSYQAQKAEKSDSISHDMTVQLAVGIPVGILVTLTVVLTAVTLWRIHRKRRRPRNTYRGDGDPSSTPHLTSLSWNQPADAAAGLYQGASAASAAGGPVAGRGPPSWGSYNVGQGHGNVAHHDFGAVPLQVALDGEGGGRCSPPPAYESLGYEEQPMTPPPYDSIVKDAEEGDDGDHR